MRLRTTVLAGALALAGLFAFPQKADAQVTFSLGFGNNYGWGTPYAYGWGNPYAYSTPMYGYWANPYWSSPYRYGAGSPYWVGRAYSYTNPLWGGTSYYRGVYANPGWGPGYYQYRYWNGW